MTTENGDDMAGQLTICVAQINYNPGHIKEHLARIQAIIEENRACDLIVFPELILHGHPSVEKPEGLLYRKTKIIYGKTSSDLYRRIRNLGARVIIGEMRRKVDNLLNVATYADARGTQHYVKTHVHWTENFAPGNSLRIFQTPFGKVGINICFDAAFSEVWRVLALEGAEVIVNISAVPWDFPKEYMHRRCAGAALNNQVFVVYANRAGPYFSGHSAVFDPRGDIVAAAGPSEEVFRTTVDLDEVRRWRDEEAVYAHRRPSLYQKIARGPRQPVKDQQSQRDLQRSLG